MHTIVGIDSKEHGANVLRLLARIGFQNQALELLHVVDTSMPIIPIGGFSGAELSGEYMDALRNIGEDVLRDAKTKACDLGMTARATLVFGPPALTLLDYATERKADLIGVCAKLRGPFGSFVYGSVSRALTISAKQSVLVAKGEFAEHGPVRAVFAVDHSDYCNRCLNKLISMKPSGLEELLILTAFDPTSAESSQVRQRLTSIGEDLESWIEARYTEKNEAILAKLQKAGIKAKHQVLRGHPNDVIRSAMAAHKADLLILGAHGHGFIERLVVGSVSLHQVVSEAHSTMLIRA